MASNLKAKQLIYSFKEFDTLPYPNAANVEYGSGNEYMNSTALNNTFG